MTRILLLLVALVAVPAVQAQQSSPFQNRPGRVAIGAQVGAPTGLSLRVFQNSSFAYDLLVAWDIDQYLELHGHGIVERRLEDSPLNYYYGPGLYVGFEDNRDDATVLGISGMFGLNFYVARFDVFLHILPRLHVVPSTAVRVGGGVGLRYFFRSLN